MLKIRKYTHTHTPEKMYRKFSMVYCPQGRKKGLFTRILQYYSEVFKVVNKSFHSLKSINTTFCCCFSIVLEADKLLVPSPSKLLNYFYN